MKKCSICLESKPLAEFYSNGFSSSGKQKYKPACKACESDGDMTRYYDIIEKHYGKMACQRCGYDRCFAALEFHHTDPSQKEYRISNMRNYTEKKIVAELEKCVLLCSNCHREEHHGLQVFR